jgi:glycosyltransferase involved in cell wall biosynthesis
MNTPVSGPGSWRLPRRLAYVVSHSRPWSSNGYAVRTDAVARALSEAGHEVIVFTRPGRPWDIEGFHANAEVPLDRRIDGLRHICLPMPPMPGARPIARVRMAADILTEAFYAFRPAAVLAASNWENAEPARRAAGRTGAAFFYEQRGFWNMGAEAETEAERAERRQETEIALAARAVFTLNGPMRGALVQRGVPEGRIHLVPNGLSFRMRPAKRLTRDAIGCKARYLLGYVGSLSAYEGVEDLLHLTAMLRKGGPAGEPLDVAALIVGSDAPKGLLGSMAGPDAAPAQGNLRRLAAELGIADFAHFVPQLPEAEAASYFPLCDAIVLPRRRTRVTELVPPVKPYAAAAWSLPVFMTDLPPLAEIAPEINGSLFPEGDIPALAAMVHTALTKGHPATILSLDPDLDWAQRVRPIRHQLDMVAEAEQTRNAWLFGGFGPTAPDAAQAGSAPSSLVQDPATPRRFDMTILPGVGLQRDIGAAHLARIGPTAAPGQGASQDATDRVTVLTRANLLDTLATAEPGRFVIDWAGLQVEADPASDWAGLWSIDDMRLNRQIMDAVRIATERGWRVQVLGPVHRSQAPLFRTIAAVVEEILPASADQIAEQIAEKITAGDAA